MLVWPSGYFTPSPFAAFWLWPVAMYLGCNQPISTMRLCKAPFSPGKVWERNSKQTNIAMKHTPAYASPYMHLVSSLSLSGHGSKPYQRDTPTEQDPHLWERRKRGRRTFTVDNCKNLTGTNYFCYTSKSLLPKNIFMPGSPVWAYQTSRFFHSDGQLHTLHLDVDIPCNYFRGPCVLKIESRMYIITAHV